MRSWSAIRSPWRVVPVLMTMVLLGGVAAETLSRPTPKDAEPFHDRVRKACAAIPMNIGEWKGDEAPVTPAAIALLKPNVVVSRRYTHAQTGRTVHFLLVQCRDARDMAGHYPPNCYPANGWTQLSARPGEWQAEGLTAQGMEYEFTRMQEGRSINCVVINLLILPDGRFVRDIAQIRQAAADYLRQFYGAAQIQLLMDASARDEERREVFRQLIGPNMAAIQAITSAPPK